ncbi:hypothetical protein S83_026481 [Arachis hypogaea]
MGHMFGLFIFTFGQVFHCLLCVFLCLFFVCGAKLDFPMTDILLSWHYFTIKELLTLVFFKMEKDVSSYKGIIVNVGITLLFEQIDHSIVKNFKNKGIIYITIKFILFVFNNGIQGIIIYYLN